VEFWRLVAGDYQRQMPDEDGRYRPISVPGLAFQSKSLWNEERWYRAVFLGWLALSEVLTPAPLLGGAVVFAGVAIVNRVSKLS